MKNKILFCFITLLLASPAVFSQNLSSFQTIDTDNRQREHSGTQLTIGKQTETKDKKAKTKKENCNETSNTPEGKKVLIKTIVVEGSTLLSEEDLKKIVSQYENKELYLSQMEEIAGLITDAYVKNGYTASKAYLPQQTIQDNILTIKVFEDKQVK